jgi:hypothetical protein
MGRGGSRFGEGTCRNWPLFKMRILEGTVLRDERESLHLVNSPRSEIVTLHTGTGWACELDKVSRRRSGRRQK